MRTSAIGPACGLALTVLSFAGFAQDAVVVTAPRFPQEVRELPASVTVITEEEIARSSARTLPELLAGEVGFTMKDLYGNNAAITAIDLRGFGATGSQNALVLLDGRRLNDFDLSGVQWAAVPLSSIERIEILRGTGAVLYGDAASSGVVNIITRSPLKRGRAFEALGRLGSYETAEGQVHFAAANDAFGASGTLHGYRSDGYRDNNRNEQRNADLGMRWTIGDGSLDLRAGTDRQDLRLPGGRFVQPSIGLDEYATDRRGTGTPLDYASRDGTRAGLSLLQRVGEVELSVGADLREKDQRSFFDQGGFPDYREDDLELRSLTPRVRARLGGHRLVLGADWHSWRYRSARADRPENIGQPANRVAVDQDTSGYYVQDTVELRPGTLLSAGWRRERARYAGEDRADPASPACAFCTEAPSVRETQRQRAWEAGLRHELSPGWAAFGRMGRSFRFVNAEEIYESNAFFAAEFQLLRPQHARTREAGIEWRGGASAARATLFRIDTRDEIHLDPFTTGVGNTNLPPARRQGIELDGRWQAARGLRLSAGYAYTEAEFLEGRLAGSPFAIGTDLDIAGRTVPLVPRHKLNAAVGWDVAPGMLVSALFTAVSEQVLDNDEPNTLEHRIPPYYVADLKLTQRFAWGRLSATVNNVFNEHYYTYAVRSAFTPDRYAVYPLPGRTFSLAAELSF